MKYFNIIRWKYFVPRALVVAALVITVRFGLDPLIHYIIVTAGQSATGAKVELASVETSVRGGHLELRGLQVANPESPLRNLVEAESTRLELDLNALMHKRIVVRNGEIAGLVFDTERSETGELEVVGEENSEPSALDPLVAKASEWADNWLDQASDRLDKDFTEQLQTPQVAKKIEQRWQLQATELRQRAEELKARGKQLETDFREIKSNPLRGVERLPAVQAELKNVKVELASLQQEIKSLPDRLKSDRDALTAARQTDEAFIKQQLKFGKLDGDNLTQLLLGKPVAENLQSGLDWIGWARKKVPTNSTKEIVKMRSRGTNVNFAAPQPKFYIERLGLTLTAPVGGTPMNFIGSLSNVSSEPHLIAEPTRLDLIARGDLPITLEVISDHRSEIPRDELFLACAAIPLKGQTVGRQDKLAIQLAPGTANLRVELVLTGDELAGQINFKQNQFQITPLANAHGNQTLMTAIGKALKKIDDLSAEVILAGTLKNPEFKIKSQLGNQIATGVSTAVLDLASQKSEALLADVSAKMNEQFARLESAKEKLQTELLAKLGENQQLVEGLAALSGSSGGLSVPSLGSLGSGFLRK